MGSAAAKTAVRRMAAESDRSGHCKALTNYAVSKSAKKPAAKKATAAKGGVEKKGKGGVSSCLKDSCAVKVSQCCKGPCCMCMSESAAPVVKPAACHDGGVCCLPAHTAAV